MIIKEKSVQYRIASDNGFVIENYSVAKPFASFLPGVAGPFGIPIWAFYVNRGQGIASFGVCDKDHAIMQFYPLNRSYEQTTLKGFRTFIKVIQKNESRYYEPFQNSLGNQAYELTQNMKITPWDFSLQERNMTLGLETKVTYFGVPNEYFGSLARRVILKNTSGEPVRMELLDGLPVIVPFGLKESYLQSMSRTMEAWMRVQTLSKKDAAAFFHLNANPQDRAEYELISGAHFYIASSNGIKAKKLITPQLIVDPSCIFGVNLDFWDPRNFLLNTPFSRNREQVFENKTPCAFSAYEIELAPAQEIELYSYLGLSSNPKRIAKDYSRIASEKFFAEKLREQRQIIEELQSPLKTVSASREYNLYCQQTYLDNVLRGGQPQVISRGKDARVFHIYSRKHGDLERDYNRFSIEPSFLSQGEGNYRDVNQNRRNEVWFNPQVFDNNIQTFVNLIQTDGYNPLLVQAVRFPTRSLRRLRKNLSKFLSQEHLDKVMAYVDKPRSPGQLLTFIDNAGIHMNGTRDEIVNTFCLEADQVVGASHGEGFWSEHWTYNLDAIESFLAIYPDELENLLIRRKIFTFYDNANIVRPRSGKYVEVSDGVIRQYHAVKRDEEKASLIASRKIEPHKVRTRYGRGSVYSGTLLTKLLSIVLNKYASLDAQGIGLEMEADKPDWFDALNGLPGLMGSSLSGTYELLRLLRFLEESLNMIHFKKNARVFIPMELAVLLKKLDLATRRFHGRKSKSRNFVFWDKTHDAKEAYWAVTRLGLKGTETRIPVKKLKTVLKGFSSKLTEGIHRAYDPAKEVCPTYFTNEITEYSARKNKNIKVIEPKKFRQKRLPPFLEGPVHALRVEKSSQAVYQIYNAVRTSELFDRKLGMYRVTGSLQNQSPEIGRVRMFPPGWLENQSVFLHMEYKFLLELLRRGISGPFFADFRSALIPFQDPKVYGRSIFENSSFIASSAYSDKNFHGTGFVARLSGSTAEFLEMWLLMNVGNKPFFLGEDGELCFRLQPVLAPWLFTDKESRNDFILRDGSNVSLFLPKNSFAFLFLGQTIITYHNPRKQATFGPKRAMLKRISFKDPKGELVIVNGNTLSGVHASWVREGKIRRLDVELG